VDNQTATKIAEAIKGRYPDAQVVDTGGGFVNVYWTDDIDGELRSYVLGDEGGDFGVDTYKGDYMQDEDALYLWPYVFDDMTIEEVIKELLAAPSEQR
jgi:hypothetical protein